MKTRKPPKPKEAEIQKSAIALLRSRRWPTYRRNTGAMTASYKGRNRLIRFSEPGMSDLWGVVPVGPFAGAHAEIEIKRPGNWPTDAQIAWLESMNGVGGSVAFWVASLDDLAEVVRHVEAGGRIRFEPGGTGRYELVEAPCPRS